MPFSANPVSVVPVALVESFFRESAGHWRSERRYYTLKSGETQEVVSQIRVGFLGAGAPELLHLAQLHELPVQDPILCGALVSWESDYVGSGKRPVAGSTVFGVRGDVLFRDRGFATSKPVTADYRFRDAKTMQLRTEYNGSVFEEEVKLIGHQYRTRQTVISRAGEELMIGQYLEKRC